jgi:hypothetical protein
VTGRRLQPSAQRRRSRAAASRRVSIPIGSTSKTTAALRAAFFVSGVARPDLTFGYARPRAAVPRQDERVALRQPPTLSDPPWLGPQPLPLAWSIPIGSTKQDKELTRSTVEVISAAFVRLTPS